MQHDLNRWLSWIEQLADKDFVIIDGFLDGFLYEEMARFFFSKLPQFTLAGIGALDDNIIKKTVRGDSTYWLDRARDTEINDFWALIDEAVQALNRYCFLSLSGDEFHLAHYPVGSHYDKHVDQFAQRNNRMISMVIYLNSDWSQGDGGELEVFNKDGSSVMVAPMAKRCVLFKSAEVLHQVHLAQKDRYSITGWLLYQPAALGQFFG